MDTLSQLLEDISLHGAEFIDVRLTAPANLRMSTPGQASFHIITQGDCYLTAKGHDNLALTNGDIVILPDGLDHQITDTPDSRLEPYNIMAPGHWQPGEVLRIGGQGRTINLLSGFFRFDTDLAKPLITALPDMIHLQSLSRRPPTWLRLGLMFLADELSQQRPAQQAIINRLADLMFIECLRNYVDSIPEASDNWLLALRDPALSATLAAIHRHPERNWTVPQLADIACLSRSGFAARFTAVLGEPPLSYLTRHRMRLAAWQLSHSRQPVCRIAEQVGYGSDTAFSQAFKRHYLTSPRHYREQQLRLQEA